MKKIPDYDVLPVICRCEKNVMMNNSGNDKLQDTCTSSEDYVINSNMTEEQIVVIMTELGYVRDEAIRDLMWS